jgi:hypothetical protein
MNERLKMIDDVYKKWTVITKTRTGYSVQCKKGLWSVDAPSLEKAEHEARHYFIQYFSDGEYA